MDDFGPNFSDLQGLGSGPEEYGRFQQHLGLLEDTIRLATFFRAIQQTSPGRCVVDVGAGTGILTIMALKHGYEHAILIEPSRKISAYSEYLLNKNGFAGRYSLINKPLELCDSAVFAEKIDLVVTETLSSLLFGFGSWKAMNGLAERLDTTGAIIPAEGKLLGFLCTKDYSYRPEATNGIGFLRSHGINVDLHLRTFRSSGNVLDKSAVNYELSNGLHNVMVLAGFSFLERTMSSGFTAARIIAKSDAQLLGLMTFWEVLLCRGKRPLQLSSRDPALTSWYPYYIPFASPITVTPGEEFRIELRELPLDAPYPSAFQVTINNQPVTHTLYW